MCLASLAYILMGVICHNIYRGIQNGQAGLKGELQSLPSLFCWGVNVNGLVL